MPITFTLMALVGTGMHLMGLNLPLPEVIISASVLLFGILLALKQPPAPFIVLALAAISGLFHGYAYGEAIVGADMGPLFLIYWVLLAFKWSSRSQPILPQSALLQNLKWAPSIFDLPGLLLLG